MHLYHLDLKVSMYKTEYIKKLFLKLKENGYDGIVVEIDNKLKFPSHPDFAAKDALDAETWKEIVLFAKEQALIIYPLIQTLGHMEHVLEGSSKYAHLAENPGNPYMLCPSKPGTMRLAKDLVLDIIEVFDKPEYIHLGGDEVYGHMDSRGLNKCPICYTRDSGKQLNDFLVELAEFCVQQGVSPELWADEVLANPENIERFPKETRFVDWYYARTERYNDNAGILWGAKDLIGRPIDEKFFEEVPDKLKCLLPFAIKETESGRKFNNFYGAEYIVSKGYKASIGSGVRFAGDCYVIPRIHIGSRNVGMSEIISKELGCAHLVTSWAVRLNHPETTWPSLRAISNISEVQINSFTRDLALYEDNTAGLETAGETEKLIEHIGLPLGGIDMEHILLLMDVSKGYHSIDILLERNMRFERPFVDNYLKAIYEISTGKDRDNTVSQMEKRVESARKILSHLNDNLNQGKGDRDCLMHWINGIELVTLRTEQALAIIDSYKNGVDRDKIKDLLERNISLMKEFEELWGESVTEYSLEQEKEIKFKRDIRMLENLLSS